MMEINVPITQSVNTKNVAATATSSSTMPVDIMVSLRVGQVTFSISCRTSRTNLAGFTLDIGGVDSFYGDSNMGEVVVYIEKEKSFQGILFTNPRNAIDASPPNH
jgi:hypothetical protein